jgi:uncharacterized membrane protein YfcA
MKKFFALRGGKTARLVTFGLLSGLVNGLLGAGGGILIVFGLAPLIARNSEDRRDVFANALCVMLPVSVVSLINYTAAGHLPEADFAPILIPCVIGGAIGALLLDRVNTTLLQRLFALIVIWSGAAMIFF